jgi:transcriptional regulator with XRE-family HTH domain
MSQELSAWLRQQRQAHGWPVPEMARQLRLAAKDAGDTAVPSNEALCRNIRRWESGHGGVSERYKLHYCKALDLPPGQFGPSRPQEIAVAQATTPATPCPPLSGPGLSRHTRHPARMDWAGPRPPMSLTVGCRSQIWAVPGSNERY